MGKGAFKLLTVRGIDIKAHWSLIFIVLLVTYTLAAANFPVRFPGESALTYWGLGFVAALLFFTSVVLHELAHAFVARSRGLPVKDIVLFIFGGVANIGEEPKKASDEFWIAAVGPLTSLGLAALFYGLLFVITPPVRQAGAYAASIFEFLARVNFMLALFNLIPGFPLDGGRVLRAGIWGITRNFDTATRIAGSVGQLVAYGFIAWGFYEAFVIDNLSSGLWTAFIGWFLLNAARQSTAATTIRDKVRGITVANVMQPTPPSVAPHMTIAHLLSQFILPQNLRALPVVQEGQLVGIATLGDIKDVPQDQWGIVTAGEVMTGSDKLVVARPQDGLERAMELLGQGDFDQLPVVDQAGSLVGLLTRAHLLRWLQIRDELKLGGGQAQA